MLKKFKKWIDENSFMITIYVIQGVLSVFCICIFILSLFGLYTILQRGF